MDDRALITKWLGPRINRAWMRTLSCPYTSNFFAWDGDAICLKIVASQARGENRTCSYPRTGDAAAEKNHRKNREKFNVL